MQIRACFNSAARHHSKVSSERPADNSNGSNSPASISTPIKPAAKFGFDATGTAGLGDAFGLGDDVIVFLTGEGAAAFLTGEGAAFFAGAGVKAEAFFAGAGVKAEAFFAGAENAATFLTGAGALFTGALFTGAGADAVFFAGTPNGLKLDFNAAATA
jgi:hypothetical protein